MTIIKKVTLKDGLIKLEESAATCDPHEKCPKCLVRDG